MNSLRSIITNWNPQLYEQLLNNEEMLTIKQFSEFLNITHPIFRIEEFWGTSFDKYALVDNDMIRYLGYDGLYGDAKKHMLNTLTNNFTDGIDYIHNKSYKKDVNNTLDKEIVIEDKNPRPREIPLYINYFCFKELSLMIQTDKAREIRFLYILRAELFKYYSQYQIDYQQCLLKKNKQSS